MVSLPAVKSLHWRQEELTKCFVLQLNVTGQTGLALLMEIQRPMSFLIKSLQFIVHT